MTNIVCINHPQYDGTTSPVLSCKCCCGLFLAALRTKHTDGVIVRKEEKVL